MRVLHVIPGIAARYGGPSRAIIETCKALDEVGLDSLIVTTDADGAFRLPVEIGRPIEYEGVNVLFWPKQISEAFKYSYPLSRWLFNNVETFDLVHIDAVFSHSSMAAAAACRRHNVPYVVRPLGSLSHWSMKRRRVKKMLLWHAGVKQMLENAAAIHFTTHLERELAEKLIGKTRSVVIPLGVKVRDGSIPPNSVQEFCAKYECIPHNYILALSRIHPVKGLDVLVEAFSRVIQHLQFRSWKLLIAGQGESAYVDWLRSQIRKFKVDKSIIFCGWLEGSDKLRAIKGAALLVSPSHHENFGISIVESLGAGLPVLISNKVSLATEIILANAGWVVDLDVNSIELGLLEALKDPDERVRRGEAGKILVERRFSWETVAQDLKHLYEEIVHV